MPPKTKFSKDEVINAAVSVVDKGGLGSLTARNVAAKLGSSTAPVYNHFETMDDLAFYVMKETQKALLEYSSRPYTEREFLNMGTGVAMFALEHGQLYKALMLEGDNYSDVVKEFFETLESEMIRDKRFTLLSEGERHELLSKMWTFTHGLASLICVGLIKNCDQDYITRTLLGIGADVIGTTMAKHGNKSKNG